VNQQKNKGKHDERGCRQLSWTGQRKGGWEREGHDGKMHKGAKEKKGRQRKKAKSPVREFGGGNKLKINQQRKSQ